MSNKIITFIVMGGLSILITACSDFQSAKKTHSFPSNIVDNNTTSGNFGKMEVALSAVNQLVADVQLSQFDALLNAPGLQQSLGEGNPSASGGWGAVAQDALNARLGVNGKETSGWGGGGHQPSRDNKPADTFQLVRDCDLGGTASSSFKALNINKLGAAAFSKDTTSKMETETSTIVLELKNCRFADAARAVYVVDGTLNVPVKSLSEGVFTVKATTFSVESVGAAEVKGHLSFTLPDGKFNCQINAQTQAEGTKAEVQRAQRKGSIQFLSQIKGSVCGSDIETHSASAKVTF